MFLSKQCTNCQVMNHFVEMEIPYDVEAWECWNCQSLYWWFEDLSNYYGGISPTKEHKIISGDFTRIQGIG